VRVLSLVFVGAVGTGGSFDARSCGRVCRVRYGNVFDKRMMMGETKSSDYDWVYPPRRIRVFFLLVGLRLIINNIIGLFY
jgi:hypothetical protein